MRITSSRLLFIFLLPGVAAPAAGQDAADMETVVVSAARTPLRPDRIGSSYTLIDAEQLQRRQSAPLSEILRDVPGVAVSRSGGFGAVTQLRMRGGEANQVLVLIDGVEANDPAQGSEFDFAHLMNSEVERIEIIRGPQSSLWGSDALSGVINIVPKRGSGPVGVSGFVEGGAFGSARGGLSAGGSGDTYGFRIGGQYAASGGDNISRTGDEGDGYENATVTASLDFQPVETLSFTGFARHTDASTEFDAIDFVFTGLPVDADNVTHTAQDYARIGATLSPAGGRWEHRAGVAFTGTDNETREGGFETAASRGEKLKFDYQGSLRMETPDMLAAAHVLTFAVEHELEDFVQRGPASPFGDPNQDRDMGATGITGEYRAVLGEQGVFSAGLRHDMNSAFRDRTTFRVTGLWHLPLPGARLHGSYGTGVKNPTFTERFGFFATSIPPFTGNPELRPELSVSWEVGAGFDGMDGRLRADATYFNADLEDEINGFVFDPATGGFTAQNVGGESRREGVELTVSAEITDQISVHANYTWLAATQPDALGQQQRELRRPRHSGSVNLNYAFLDRRANLNLNATFTGDQVDAFFPPFPQPSRRVILDGFTRVSLTGSYQVTDAIALYGRVENLLDEDYEEVFGFSGMGAAAYGGLRFSFNP